MGIIDELKEQNSWWLDRSAIKQDLHLKELEGLPFQRIPKLLSEIEVKSSKLYTLRGPRQVGKTTLLKILIRDILREDVPPQAITYFPLDLVTDYREIVEIVRSVTELFPEVSGQRYFFLDEISSVPNWQRAIKYIRDSNLGRNDFFLLTGSSARDIRRGAERLPGRRKAGLDKILLPLNFKEFLKLRYPKIETKSFSIPEFLSKESESDLKKGMLFLRELQKALDEYIMVGGFPQAVAEFIEKGMVTREFFQILWSSIAGDIERWGRDRIMALKLLERLRKSLGSSLSWHNLAGATGFSSPVTAEEYTEIMSEEFVLLVLYFLDLSKMSISPKKGKKIYFTDALFYHLWEQISKGKQSRELSIEETSSIMENIVAMEIFSAVEKEKVESFSAPQHLFYWRSGSQKEIDFLVRINKQIIPVEVKYKERISPQELLTIKNSFGRGLVLSKKDMDLSASIKIIPLSIFLWMLAD